MGDIVRRGTAWYVRYKDVDGVRRMRASHQPSKELARRFLLEIEARIARGQVGIPEPMPPAPTVAELIERFLAEYSRPKIKDLAQYRMYARCVLRRALPKLGKLRADSVGAAQLESLRSDLLRNFAPASARHTLSFVSTLFSGAVKTRIVATNPMKGVEKPVAPSSLEYLSRDEVQALLTLGEKRAAEGSIIDRCLFVAVHLALHAGLRRGELLGLRLQDVDLRMRRLTVARSFRGLPKNGKARYIRLPESTLPVLAAWLAEVPRQLGIVFPVLYGFAPRRATRDDVLNLPVLLADAGCRSMLRPWHALRHTFASHFIMSGGNLLALQKILGHANIAETMRYAHLADDYMAGEIDKLRF